MLARVPRPILWGGLGFLCMVAAWLAGNQQGHEFAEQQVAELQIRADTEILRQQKLISRQQLELEQITLDHEISNARTAALQLELNDSLETSADDAAELALYRRIGGTSGQRGVWVDQVSLVDGQPDQLAITLLQSRGRGRAAGRIGVALAGGAGGADRYWVVTDSQSGVVVEQRNRAPGVNEVGVRRNKSSDDVVTIESFDLRFFQTVLVKVKNITTIDPEYIEISIQPDEKPLKPSVQRFRWAEIRS